MLSCLYGVIIILLVTDVVTYLSVVVFIMCKAVSPFTSYLSVELDAHAPGVCLHALMSWVVELSTIIVNGREKPRRAIEKAAPRGCHIYFPAPP